MPCTSQLKVPSTLRHVQGSLSRSLVLRPKGVILVLLHLFVLSPTTAYPHKKNAVYREVANIRERLQLVYQRGYKTCPINAAEVLGTLAGITVSPFPVRPSLSVVPLGLSVVRPSQCLMSPFSIHCDPSRLSIDE